MQIHLLKLITDFWGLLRTCGFFLAIKWLCGIILNFKSCLKQKNLQSADLFLGSGPFSVSRGGNKIKLIGENVITGIREIWVRDIYLQNGILKIPYSGTIVDLGANIGNFSLLAATLSGIDSKIISVEPNVQLNTSFMKNVSANKFENRIKLQSYFLGGITKFHEEMLSKEEYKSCEVITSEDFIDRNNIKSIDFLKCDIEGSEFGLIDGNAALFNISKNIAVEIHDHAGSRDYFISRIKELGFTEIKIQHNASDCILLAKKWDL